MNLYTTAAIIFVALASVVSAGTDPVTGCETRPIENSNALQYAVPGCADAWARATGNEGTPDHEIPVEEDEEEAEEAESKA